LVPNSAVLGFAPVPGTWTLIVDVAPFVVGDEVSQPFTGNVKLDDVTASAPGLPNDRQIKLAAGVPVTVPVTITNNGAGPQAIFIDARLDATTEVELASQTPLFPGFAPNNFQYPLPITFYQPFWLVPSETSSLLATATGNVPLNSIWSRS
jgi:hypothetical protein